MDKAELEKRTTYFAIRIIQFVAVLPKSKVTDVVGYQLLKSGTSIGANYREANRAVSRPDFVNKIGIVEKEAAETQYWLELCEKATIGNLSLTGNGFSMRLPNFLPYSLLSAKPVRNVGESLTSQSH